MSRKPFVVGVVGGSASGKTSFLRELVARLPAGACAVVSQDNYYRPKAEQHRDEAGEPNFDLPTAIDRDRFVRDLRALLAGQPITQREYTFNVTDRPPREIVIAPAAVLIVEGLFVFHDDEVRSLLDLRVYLDAPGAVCFDRRLARDLRERGYTEAMIRYQWDHHVRPAYQRYVRPHRDAAHVLIDCAESYAAGLDAVCQHIAARLA